MVHKVYNSFYIVFGSYSRSLSLYFTVFDQHMHTFMHNEDFIKQTLERAMKMVVGLDAAML
jgi:hypothetical protein